jgi:hypothetical protein
MLLPSVDVRIESEVWERSGGDVLKTVVRVPKGKPRAGTFFGVTNQTLERKLR